MDCFPSLFLENWLLTELALEEEEDYGMVQDLDQNLGQGLGWDLDQRWDQYLDQKLIFELEQSWD